jgi:hypothetical protein
MRYVTACLMLTTVFSSSALADPRTDCPDASPCKVVTISAQEEKVLLDERGILATAAQARQLDLGGLATYFQQKIAKAPAGDPKEVPKPEAKPAEPPAVNLTPPDVKPN